MVYIPKCHKNSNRTFWVILLTDRTRRSRTVHWLSDGAVCAICRHCRRGCATHPFYIKVINRFTADTTPSHSSIPRPSCCASSCGRLLSLSEDFRFSDGRDVIDCLTLVSLIASPVDPRLSAVRYTKDLEHCGLHSSSQQRNTLSSIHLQH